MDFQVLGPVAAHEQAAEVPLGGPKQRLVLAILLAARGSTVTTDALIDGLWNEAAPATARKTVQGYVHHLRSSIGDVLATERAGYSLKLTDTDVDERRFCSAIEQARQQLGLDPVRASETLTGALGLWRGNPYADLDGEPVLRPEITRLNESRLVALGDRIDAELALGRHELLIGELESLAVEYPLQERFRSQLMIALYRAGRHGDALRAYARTRDQFIDELGIEPSDRLAGLEHRILQRDPSLQVESHQTNGAVRAVRGYELRDIVSGDWSETVRGYQRSVGREVAIRAIGPPDADDSRFIARYEADTARVANLHHPHIVDILDTWREPGRVYQVLRWVDGDRLEHFLAEREIGAPAALRIIGQIGDAIAAAHAAGVVHGAVSTDAILITAESDAYLTDFVIGRPPGEVADDRLAFARLAKDLLGRVATPIDARSTRGANAASDLSVRTVIGAEFTSADVPRPDDLARSLQRALGVNALGPSGAPKPRRPDTRCPYKGLRAFQSSDAGDFFGRDELVTRLQEALDQRRLVAVVGPSGSGKSSAVKAGLIPRLQGGRDPPLVVEMSPGPYPFNELEDALRRVAVRAGPLADDLTVDHHGLERVLESVLPDHPTELVLAIDQFEELFVLVAAESVRTLFLDSLVAAVSAPRSRLRVILTMRGDFFDRPLRYPAFGALVESGLVPVTMPDSDGLRAAVEGPATAVGLDVEPGLASEVAGHVSDQPGGLPLMQYALTELFDRRAADLLTLEAYRASGGVAGALANRAEKLFNDLGPPAQRALKQAFLRLVTVDESGENLRRRVTRSDLAALEIDRTALDDGLRRFGAHRLLTFDADPVSRAPTVEVAHEALLGAWARLAGWIDDERGELVLRRRLDTAISEWRDSGSDAAYLLTGGRLAQFDNWAAETELALTAGEREFLGASRERDAELARRATGRRRRVMVVLATAALVAAAFGLYAVAQRDVAARRARDAETARIGSQAGFVSEWNRQLALLMAVETYRRDPGFEGLSALQRALVDGGPFLGVLGEGQAYREVEWATTDRLVATTDAAVHVVDVVAREVTELPIELAPATQPAPGPGSPVSGLRASSPVGFAAVADGRGRLFVVDARDGAVESFRSGHGSTAAAISNDGNLIAVGWDDGRVAIFDRRSGARTAEVLAHPVRRAADVELDPGVTLGGSVDDRLGRITGLVFSPDDRHLVTSAGVLVRAWHTSGLVPAGPEIVISWGEDDFNLVAAQPRNLWIDKADGRLVGTGDTYVVTWDLSTGRRASLGTLPVGTSPASGNGTARDAVPAGSGRLLALAVDGRVTEHRIEELGQPAADASDQLGFVFDTHRNQVNALAIDQGRRRFAVASGGGIVLGSLDGTGLIARSIPIGSSVRPSLSRDGRLLAAGLASDGLFDLTADPPERLTFDVGVEVAQYAGSPATFRFSPNSEPQALLWTSTFMELRNAYDASSGDYLGDFWGRFIPAWSGDGRMVARVDRAGRTVVASVGDGPVFEHRTAMTSADFDSTGQRVLLTFGDDHETAGSIVDLPTGAARPLPDMPGGVVAAAFTPDDGEVVVLGGSGAVWRLDAATLDRVGELQDGDPPTGELHPPVFTADGRWMFSAADGSARLWDVASGRLVGRPLPAEPGGVPYGVADGSLLRVVTPLAGKALIWNLDTDSWVDVACRAAGRNMTITEWATFGPRDTDYRATCPGESRGAQP